MQLGALIEKLAADVPGQQERQSVNITKVEELIRSRENAPDIHKSSREIEQITGIARSSVVMLTYVLAHHIGLLQRHYINFWSFDRSLRDT